MTSVLDILINEIANVLGISAEEVKTKFTQEQLNELLNLSLCEPTSESGIPLDITEAPCDDLAIPNLLPPLSTDGLDDLAKTAENNAKNNNITQCLDKVEELNKTIEENNQKYVDHRLLLDKLIEYRDNYAVMSYYYDERSKEAARILNTFGPLITELRRLEKKLSDLTIQLDQTRRGFGSTGLFFGMTGPSQNDERRLELEIEITKSKISEQNGLITQKTISFPIFTNPYYQEVNKYIVENGFSISSTGISSYLKNLFENYFSSSTLTSINSQIDDYSECIKSKTSDLGAPRSIKEAIERNYFSFRLKFPQLAYIRLPKEKFNKETGETYTEDNIFPIRNSPLLQKNSFFSNTGSITIEDFPLSGDTLPTGLLYTQYYNLFKDPVNNLFSLAERGLTVSSGEVDPKLKGTGAERKREKNSEYYIRDAEVMQNFYQNFDEKLEQRKNERRAQVVTPAQEAIRLTMRTVARKEVQLILAVSRANVYLPGENSIINTTLEIFNRQNNAFLQGLSDLDSEISRIQNLLPTLKPTPQKVKALLKEKSPECFNKEEEPSDANSPDCSGAKSKLGIDPFFTESRNGCDPTLPNQNQLCYWVEFSKAATTAGLIPVPNLPNVTQLRYWPVGLIVPYPAGLIKIPLPIIWIPLVTFSTPLGNIVIFLTVNGIFITPVVFFVSSGGFKQHILTVKGPSKKFGYTKDDASIKPGIQLPLLALAAKDTATRLARESSEGKYYNLSEKEKAQLQQQKNILDKADAAATKNGNANRKLKVAREKKNFEQATSNLSPYEKMRKIVDRDDSLKDVIDDAKQAIFSRLDNLGKPALAASNKIKEKITSRNNQLLSDLQKALLNGDLSAVKKIRGDMGSDGVSLIEKIDAIKSDAMTYFDRINFPSVTIPKDASTIDPKLNSIVDFLRHISEFGSMYKTQFFSKDDAKVRNILSIQIAKSKSKLKSVADKSTSDLGTIDIEKEPEKVKEVLLKSNETIINAATGKANTDNPSDQKKKVDELNDKLKNEKDPTKRIQLKKDIQSAQVKFSEALDNERVKQSLALTPAVVASLAQISVDFNPFAPCCAKKSFALNLGVSPAIPIFESVKSLLDSKVNAMSVQDLKSLFGGKSLVTSREILSGYLGMIKKTVSADLEIPLPDLSLITFAKSFAGVLGALFEPKAPNLALQPALPASITIDLDILKRPLASLFLKFLENCLPDPNPPAPTNTGITPSSATGAPKNEISTTTANAQQTSSALPGRTNLSDDIELVNCEPDTTQDSPFSGGTIKPKSKPEKEGDPETSSSLLQPYQKPTSSAFSSGNAILNSKKDLLPNFSTLNTDFLNVNPGDILSILKNFIDLKFDEVEQLIDPFYQLLKTVKGVKGSNLNVLEAAQYKAPPYGPAAKAIFDSTNRIKQQLPRSATVKIINTEAVEAGAKTLKTVLSPIASSPLPAAVVAGAGAVDSVQPALKVPSVDSDTGALVTKDLRVATYALRALHPLFLQEDLPPWERLTIKNLLFLLFLDEFIANGADKIGFFRAYI